MTIYNKTFLASQGVHYDLDHYDFIIDEHEAFGYSPDGKVLFVLLKNVISHENIELSKECFLDMSRKTSQNRGFAGGSIDGKARVYVGNQSYASVSSKSNIAGFYDRPIRQHMKHFKGSRVVCRSTAFTLKEGSLWNKSYPFLKQVSDCYKKYGGEYYEKQKEEYDCIRDELKIKDTVFTTITTNLDFRTACHVDKGDYSKGLGVLCFVGSFKGGYVGFPEYKVCLKCEEGDLLLCNVHEYHCNTEIDLNYSYRLSFVFYIREDMKKCNAEKTVIDGNIYEYYGVKTDLK